MKDSSAPANLGRLRGLGVDGPLTEDSAALRFKELFEGSLCFCHSQGTWLKWDGAIWRHERKGLAFHWSRAMIREMAASQDARGMAIAGKMAFAGGVERGSRA